MADITARKPLEADDDYRRPSHAQLWRSHLVRDKKALVGSIVLGLLVFCAVFAQWIVPYDPNAMDYDMIGRPSWCIRSVPTTLAAICSAA